MLGLEFLGAIPISDGKAQQETEGGAIHPRSIAKALKISDYVIDHPLSSFAETLRSAKIAVDVFAGERKRPKIIGMVSVLPGEGKSTVSVNFAELLASQGARVLLIDGDLRNPGSTRALGRHAEAGLLEVLQDGKSIWDCLLINSKTKLVFLPAIVKRRIPYSSECCRRMRWAGFWPKSRKSSTISSSTCRRWPRSWMRAPSRRAWMPMSSSSNGERPPQDCPLDA